MSSIPPHRKQLLTYIGNRPNTKSISSLSFEKAKVFYVNIPSLHSVGVEVFNIPDFPCFKQIQGKLLSLVKEKLVLENRA